MKKFIITDFNKPQNTHHCMGCFGCFIKTPGKCVIADDCQNQGQKIGHCEELIVISKCVYGQYTADVKVQMDRCLPGLHADFEVAEGIMRHALRYDNAPMLKVYFYGDITEDERKLAEKVVDGNRRNLGCRGCTVEFCATAEEAVKAAGLSEEELR